MKVFISWSGDRAKHIADALHWWLPHVVHSAQPFVSQHDIPKGRRGIDVIAEYLGSSNVGIIVLTPENLNKPWINFEAGALSRLGESSVCTFLHELNTSDVAPPLGDFQATKNEKNDILKLCQELNRKAPVPRAERFIEETFEMWYPRFVEKFQAEMPSAFEVPSRRTLDEKVEEVLTILRERITLVNPPIQANLPDDFVPNLIPDVLPAIVSAISRAAHSSQEIRRSMRDRLFEIMSEVDNLPAEDKVSLSNFMDYFIAETPLTQPLGDNWTRGRGLAHKLGLVVVDETTRQVLLTVKGQYWQPSRPPGLR